MDTFLRDQRRTHALSAQDVARRLEVHPGSVLRWERRERLPGPLHVKALAHTLALDTSTVAGFFDDARPASLPADGIRGPGLRAVRLAAGVPVRAIATRLGVPPASVYNWEHGRARIPSALVPSLADLLGIDAPALTELVRRPPAGPAARTPTASPLRRLRRRTGLSQEAVAHRIGATRHRLGAWERGAPPPLWAVRRLARVYGVPVLAVARATGVTAPPLLDRRRWSAGDLPAVLVVLRRWSGLTQRDVAERCGCRTPTVGTWERGRARPAARTRRRLEELYGLPEGALLAAYPGAGRG